MLARFDRQCKRSQVVSDDVALSSKRRPASPIFRAEKRANWQVPDFSTARAGQVEEVIGEAVGMAPMILPSGHDGDGAGCEADQLLRDAAEQQPGQLAAAAPAQHDHLDRVARRDIDQ